MTDSVCTRYYLAMTNTANTTARYRALGTTQDFDTCECCGRTGLKKVVALQTPEGDITYFGTACAAKATGWTTTEVTRAAKKADDEKRRAEDRARAAAEAARREAYYAWLAAETGTSIEAVRADDYTVAVKAFGSVLKAWSAHLEHQKAAAA